MSFNPKSLFIKPVKTPSVSTKNLTLPHGTLKVGHGVKAQHVAKVNFGKTNKISQKGSAQL